MNHRRLLAPLAFVPFLALLVVGATLAQDMLRPRQVYTVEKDGQELFNQPVLYMGIKGRLAKGQQLGIKASQGRWRQVEGDGQEGWVQTPVQRRYGSAPVSEEYLSDATTAPIGAGLVTKGFGEAYGRQYGEDAETAGEVAAALEAPRFELADYESFLRGGDLVYDELVVAAAAPQEGDEGAATAGTEKAQDPGEPASGGEQPESDREAFLRDMKRGMRNQREGVAAAADPLFFTRNLSYEAEREMGLAVGQRLAEGRIYDDEMLTRYVSLIGAAVVEHCDRTDIPYRFIVLESDEVNAFAAPGGFIFVTTGCIRACKNEAELAGVIAHEVAHVARRHALRTMDKHKLQIQKQMQAAELDKAIDEYMGGMDPETAQVVRKLRGLADESYKFCTQGWGQEFELEADAYGLRYACAVGWHYTGLVAFLKTLEKGEKVSLGEAFRSHPPAIERVKLLKRLINENRIPPTGILNEQRFLEYTESLR